jgi:hypothetical protein
MSRGRVVGISVVILLALAVVSYLFYTKTGGNALTRVVWHYFIPNIPDKKYSWQDFTDRGTTQGISGFYAYGDDTGFRMWTLSGLKHFAHVPGISIYQYEDVCSAVRELVELGEYANGAAQAEQYVTGDISRWQSVMIKPENLVTVVRLDDQNYSNGVDKVWSYSGKYKKLNTLEQGVCD